jgi:hypothetical protein
MAIRNHCVILVPDFLKFYSGSIESLFYVQVLIDIDKLFSLSQKMAIALVEIEGSSTESRFKLRLSHASTTGGN